MSENTANAVSRRLVFALDSRDWLRFLVDEWWPTRVDTRGVRLGVDAACGEMASAGLVVMVWVDPAQLPPWPIAVYGDGRWRDAALDAIGPRDAEVRWPGPIPLSAVSAFSVATERERARLLAMAKGFSNVELPAQQIEIRATACNPVALDSPACEWLYSPPDQWNAIRGAAMMALWAVPTIDPWLDLFCQSLWTGASNENAATALGAPWLSAPLWTHVTPDAVQMPLWAAIREVLGAVNYRQEWRPSEVLDAIVESATLLGADAKSLSDLGKHTHAMLSDAMAIDVRRGERDSLGFALQLVLLRPTADQFVTWLDELPAMSPAVWWTGAMLAGLVTGMRDLDPQFRGGAAARNLLAVRTWKLFAGYDQPDSVWPDLFAPKPSWMLGGDRVQFVESGKKWADRKPSRRGEWFRANLSDEPTYRVALDLARRLQPSCLHRCLRIADTDLAVSGDGRMTVSKAAGRMKIKGEVRIILNENASFDDVLDVARFRDWIAAGSVAERLPAVPDSGQSEERDLGDNLSPSVEGQDSVAATPVIQLPDDPTGLSTIADFISDDEESALLAEIERGDWLDTLTRRVQHYGWKYDYRDRKIKPESYLGPLPRWAADLAERLVRDGLVSELPDQVIVNEYVGNQGIAKHVDCPECFRGAIATISLVESWSMLFRTLDGTHKVERLLQRRSAVVLDGEVREKWTHEIPKRKKEGAALRGRRISITFRKVVEPTKPKRATRRKAGT
ncbi:alpha-ketoglutarate-dependent dioxygenase AlkB [Burkholderia sp. BCC1988]|uniref:alpha-ketoglutarate-dependent dioxygenase AlkB n=1 Tax=Burkholderia sp. BCC1988 TaxID=2817443 RepID=UPI002AB2C528|nr:alpha-ketoglutarate-dependent dioxygenase AlkB [Burkholderia sp. BCC1988]